MPDPRSILTIFVTFDGRLPSMHYRESNNWYVVYSSLWLRVCAIWEKGFDGISTVALNSIEYGRWRALYIFQAFLDQAGVVLLKILFDSSDNLSILKSSRQCLDQKILRSKNLPGMKHLIELHPRGLLNVAFGVGEEVSQQWQSAQFVVCLVVCLATLCQVSLQLMITLSFAALSVFRWFGHGHCPFWWKPYDR